MDFISNLIKRPISLVRNDSMSSTSTDQGQTVSRPTTPQHLHSPLLPFDRANSPESRQKHIADIMDTLNRRDDYCPITVSVTNRVSPPITQSPCHVISQSLQTSVNSNDSDSGLNSITANKTIGEMLLQINDNLNMGDLNNSATQMSQPHLPNRPLSVCPSELTKALSLEFNAISSKSANLKDNCPQKPKEAVQAQSLILAEMAPVANNSSPSTSDCGKNVCKIEPKTDLLGGQKHKTDGVDELHKIEGVLTNISGIKTLEMTTALNLNIEDSAKIKFEDGLIPTLEAAINQREKCFQEKDSSSTPSPYLQVNKESDTATSSDNETFAECQSYQMGVVIKDNAFIADEYSFENSEMESYFSAANSRNVTLTNEEADPLSVSVNKTEELNEKEQADLQSLISVISEDDMLAQRNTHSLDVTYDEEPMDVDVSFNYLNNDSDKPIKIESPQDFALEVTMNKSKDIENAATSSTNTEFEIMESKVPLNENIKIGSSVETASDHIQTAFCITTSKSISSADTSINTAEDYETKKSVPEYSNALASHHNASKITIDMSASTSSNKSTALSPIFPIKHAECTLKQFPRSPTADTPKSISFLEKSEYTERIETERKKSVISEPNLNLSDSRKNTSLNDQSTRFAKCEKNTANLVNTNTSPNNASGDYVSSTSDAVGFVNDEVLKDPGLKNSSQKRLPFDIATSVVNEDLGHIISEQKFENEGDKRRTFNISALKGKEDKMQEELLKEKRRTFNISAPIEVSELSQSEERTVPMDLDVNFFSKQATTDNQNNIITTQTSTESPTTAVPSYLPIPTLLSSPEKIPPSTLKNRLQSEKLLGLDGCSFKVPLQPLEPATPFTHASPPMPNIQKRPSIHAYKITENNIEALSAKEQIKRDASDEKDVFTGNFTPSPIEELPSSTCTLDNMNEEFQSGNDLIFNPSDFDYLLTKGNNNTPIDRSSILLKFDPLLGVPVPVNHVKQQQQQSSKESQQLLQLLGNKTISLSPTVEEEEHSSSVSVSSISNNQSFVVEADNQQKSFDNNTINEHSLKSNKYTETSTESRQLEDIQHNQKEATLNKYASMSVDVIKDMNIDNDCNKSFENANSQLDEKQINYKMDELEKKIKNEVLKTEDIEKKLKDAEQREEALIKRITDKDKTITKMTGVIEAYEKAIAELIAEKEQLIQNYEKQLVEVKTDRDSNYQHLTSLETTFADLHVKYGKSKEMTMQLKTNEESLVSEKRQILENLRLQEQRYDKMKNHAMQQLEIANKKLESLNKEHNVETAKLRALLKKEEISRASISEQLQQKSRENDELVKICDELINGQGS